MRGGSGSGSEGRSDGGSEEGSGGRSKEGSEEGGGGGGEGAEPLRTIIRALSEYSISTITWHARRGEMEGGVRDRLNRDVACPTRPQRRTAEAPPAHAALSHLDQHAHLLDHPQELHQPHPGDEDEPARAREGELVHVRVGVRVRVRCERVPAVHMCHHGVMRTPLGRH